MKKLTLILCILLALAIVTTGCNPKPLVSKVDKPKTNDTKPVITDEPQDNDINPSHNPTNDDYYNGAVGEIIEFDGENVHIIFGDIVEIFKVKQDVSKNFYLGESVELTKDGEYFNLEAYMDKDFSIKHTNMGDIITSITGTIKEDVEGKKFTVVTGDTEYIFENYEDVSFAKDTNVTVEYVQYQGSDEKILIAVYNNDSTLELIVDSIERTDSGEMVLNAKQSHDSESIDYVVYVLGRTSVEFNHSELEPGSLIMVYPETIRESYPAQVDAQRILIGVIN